jgi:hypothetical protein
VLKRISLTLVLVAALSNGALAGEPQKVDGKEAGDLAAALKQAGAEVTGWDATRDLITSRDIICEYNDREGAENYDVCVIITGANQDLSSRRIQGKTAKALHVAVDVAAEKVGLEAGDCAMGGRCGTQIHWINCYAAKDGSSASCELYP